MILKDHVLERIITYSMGGGKGKKDFHAKQTTYFQKDAKIRNKIYCFFSKTNRHRINTNSHALNERKESCKKVSGEILPWRKQNPYKTSIG